MLKQSFVLATVIFSAFALPACSYEGDETLDDVEEVADSQYSVSAIQYTKTGGETVEEKVTCSDCTCSGSICQCRTCVVQ